MNKTLYKIIRIIAYTLFCVVGISMEITEYKLCVLLGIVLVVDIFSALEFLKD